MHCVLVFSVNFYLIPERKNLSGIVNFLCPRHLKNGGGALSVTPVCACVRPSIIKI